MRDMSGFMMLMMRMLVDSLQATEALTKIYLDTGGSFLPHFSPSFLWNTDICL